MKELSTREKLIHSTLISVELSQLATFDLISILKKSRYYKFNIKKRTKDLEKMYKGLSKYIYKITGDSISILAEASDKVDEYLKDDMFKLKISIKQELDKNGSKESLLFSDILVSQVLLNMAFGYVDAFRDYCKKEDNTDLIAFQGMDDLNKMKFTIVDISFLICNHIDQIGLDLTGNKNIQIASTVIFNKIKSAKLLNHVLN